MKNFFLSILCFSVLSFPLFGAAELVRGYSLTESEGHVYDAVEPFSETSQKTEAQLIVDKLYALGVRQINLSPRAIMTDPWRTELIPLTPPGERRDERSRYLRLIRYIKSKGMKVGIRPIFFVVDSQGKTPHVIDIAAPYKTYFLNAAKALNELAENPSLGKVKIPEAVKQLDDLTQLIRSSTTTATRVDSWILRRISNMRQRLSKELSQLEGPSLAEEARKTAEKAAEITLKKNWWHGNIEPEAPNSWFESFKTYLDLYLPIAKIGGADEFTIGAELYSLTVGIEDQWDEQQHGFPTQWLNLLNYVRGKLNPGCRIMYDINFTDDKIEAGGLTQFGGEFARWKYRLVDLAGRTDIKEKRIWQALVDFWKGLDAIGIDMYRSLATSTQEIPTDYDSLVKMLQQTSDRYATQIDNTLFEIENTPGIEIHKDAIFKEIGFRSVEKGFVDPFVFADVRGEINVLHQTAAYDALLNSFWGTKWDWFKGIVFWDAPVDLAKHGSFDIGFSPIGKNSTETVLKKFFHD